VEIQQLRVHPEGRIKSNKNFAASVVYKLRGLVYVTSTAPVLTIELGTKIVGELNKQGGLIMQPAAAKL